MNTAEELKKWFVKMGYGGKLPTDLTPICNASTVCLWKQVMDVVRPREEVTKIRNNIIINHFKKLSTTEEDLNCKHEIKEIRTWEQRRKLEEQVAFIKSQIQSTENKIKDLEESNKMRHLSMDDLRNKIRKHCKYMYLLKSKSEDLEKQVFDINDMLITVTNVTPVESDNENETEVLNLLKQCTEKLEEIARNDQDKIESVSMPKLKDSTGFLDFSFDDILSSSPILDKKRSKNVLCDALINTEKTLEPTIENLLYRYSRRSIWNNLYEVNELEKTALMKIITQPENDLTNYENEKTSLAILYAKHAEYEIKTMGLKVFAKKLENEVRFFQHKIFKDVTEKYPTCSFDLQEAIKLKQREVSVCAQAKHLCEKLSSMQVDNANNDLLRIETEVQQLDEEIISILENLKQNRDFFELLHEDAIQRSRGNCVQVKKLKLFVENLDWAEGLTHNVVHEEINTFLKYPLEYKKFGSLQDYSIGEDFDTNTLLFLITVSSSWNPPEMLLINLMKAKQKLAVLKSLRMVNNGLKEYCFDTINHQESYINYALDKIKSMLHSSNDTELRLKMAQKTIKLWMEMHIKGFISSKRVLGNSNYQHYEQLYEKFYKLLS